MMYIFIGMATALLLISLLDLIEALYFKYLTGIRSESFKEAVVMCCIGVALIVLCIVIKYKVGI